MASPRLVLVQDALSNLQRIDASAEEKLDLFKSIMLVSPLPPLTDLYTALTKEDAAKGIDQLIRKAMILLPLYENERQAKAPSSLPEDIGRQIEQEVRLSLSEKFARSPMFVAILLLVGAIATMLGFGLFTFNKDVKRADQIVSEFQSKLNDADAKIVASERELNKRLNGEIDTAVARVNDYQTNSIKLVNADLQKRMQEVELQKSDSIRRIKSSEEDFQHEKADAVQSIKEQANKMVPRLDNAGDEAVIQLREKQKAALGEFDQRSSQILSELKEPGIKTVLRKARWFIILSSAFALISILLSAFAIYKQFRSHGPPGLRAAAGGAH